MAGRRGARSGRGWDAAPPRTRRSSSSRGSDFSAPFGASGSSSSEDDTVPGGDTAPGNGTVPGDPDSGQRGTGRRGAGRADPTGSGRTGAGGFGSAEDFLAGGPRQPGGGGRGGSFGRSGGASRAGGAGAGEFGSVEDFLAAGPGLPGDPEQGAFSVTDMPGRGDRGSRGGRREEKPPPKPRDEAEVAREICLRQLATRPRTRAELATALTKREISAEVIESVLARYDEVGMIDDAAFAREWVATRHQGRGLSRRALADELRRKGVDAETAGAALDDLDPETEEATAHALAVRKVRVSRGEPDAVFRRVVGMLARKGYPAGTAIRAVKAAMEAQAAEAEADGYAELVDRIDPDALADAARSDSDPI